MDYISCVEIHGAPTEKDYDLLHAELAKAKFFFSIIGGRGDTPLRLPTGTFYCYETYSDVNEAHDAVIRAVTRTQFSFSAITAATGPDAWQADDYIHVLGAAEAVIPNA